MYKILIGIPAMCVPEGVAVNEHGYIEDVEMPDGEDLWCDFSIEYYPKEKYYLTCFETMLGFDSKEDCKNWIHTCFNVFTEYMKKNNYDTSKTLNLYEVFTEGINVKTAFKTIEDAYAFVKFAVNGFEGEGLFTTGNQNN